MIATQKNHMSALSDSQLIRRLDELVQKERETTLDIIRHIIEFDRRRLYLGLDHSSLFDYCTLQLKYSASAAVRRIQSARTIRTFPEIMSMLEKNELNFTGVCMLADILTPKNKDKLLHEARGKSKRQIEQIVARFKPGKDIPEKIKPVFVSESINQLDQKSDENKKTEGAKAPDSCSFPDNLTRKFSGKSTTAGGGRKFATKGGALQQAPILKKKFKLEFAVEPECMKKIEETKELLSRKYPDGVPLGTILEEALDAYLDKHSPNRKRKRREKRREKQETTRIPHTHSGKNNKNISNRSRHIPQALQDKVFERDGGRCTFIGRNGVRCSSTWNLHIDHIKPYARGGDHSVDNLRLRCAAHNQLEAENAYGKEFMAEKRHKSIPLIL
jgi:5-methylcytosine-specific restriction endonuclease McrA